MDRPNSIILIIADGAGIGHYTSYYYKNKKKFSMNGFTSLGLMTTHAYSDDITDSAASATSMASGVKTNIEVLGQDHNGNNLSTILDITKELGWKNVIMTTADISDATPAAFLVNTEYRDNYEDIEEQIKNNSIADYKIGEIKNLTKMTDKILHEINNEPFFMMIENEDTDTAGHENDKKLLLNAMKHIDDLVIYLLDYQMYHSDTLIILTSDHETGGVCYIEDGIKFSMKYHSANFVPVWSIGPGSELFEGLIDNTDIYNNIKLLIT